MLRILRNDVDGHRVVLTLQGHIVAGWAAVLELECQESIRSGLAVALDLSGVVFVGRAGVEALGRLARAGVGIIGCSPLLTDVLQQEGIKVDRTIGDRKKGKVPGKQGGAAEPSD